MLPYLAAGCAALLALPASQAASYPDEILSDGPLAYYRFSETITVPSLDTAINAGSLGAAGNGVYTGDYSRPVEGAIAGDGAVAFANPTLGTGYTGSMNVPNQAALNPAGGFTIEMWAKPSNATAALLSPVNSMSFISGRAGYLIYQNGATWQLRIGVTTSTAASILDGGVVTPNAWQHVVGVYSGGSSGTMRLYVNGALVGTGAATYEPNTDSPFCVGATAAPNRTFDGAVDEVAFYSAVLSAETIAAHHAARTTNAAGYADQILAAAPVGYWRLNEPVKVYPVAANAGTLGESADANFRGGAVSAAGPSAPAFPGFGAGNSAASFDGVSGYVGTPVSLNDLSPITIMGWVRVPSTSTVPGRAGFIGQNDLAEFGWHTTDTQFGIWTPTGGYVTFLPTDLIPDNWHHVAAVLSGTNITLYLNGVLKSSGGGAVTSYGSNQFKLNIGGGGILDAGGNWFPGQIDEVAIFDKALSAGRVQSLYMTATGDTSPPVLVTDPPLLQPDAVYATTTFRLIVDAAGASPLTYQWRHEGTNLPGATQATLVINNADPVLHSGAYSVVVQNPHGSATSFDTYVFVNPIVPVFFLSQPKSQVRYDGGRAVFVADVMGTEPKFQWRFNGAPIANATNATLVISPVSAAAVGSYTVVVTNAAGGATSDPATLGLRTPPADSFEELIVSLGPLAYWRLNETGEIWESATAWDYMGGYDGTHTFNVQKGVLGPRPPLFPGIESDNLAARYDGVGGGTTTGVSLVNNRSQFSILGWFRPEVQTTGRVALFGQNDVAEFGYHGTGAIGLWTPGGGFISFSTNLITPGEWYFITATADGTQMRIYLNGQQVAAGGSATANYGSSSFGFNIGTAVLDASENFFLGDIDDVAFFGRALSLAEIYQINSTATGIELRLGMEAVSVIVEDSKPSGIPHDGFSNGAVWVASDSDGTRTRDGVMRFDETVPSQVLIPAEPTFRTPQGTVCFWMRTDDTSVGNGAMIMDRRGSNGEILVLNASGQIAWQPSWLYSDTTTVSVNDGYWRHIAYVYDQTAGGYSSVYVDGVLDKTHLNPGAWTWDNRAIEIGLSHDSYWTPFTGQLDDIRFYNRELTAGEIAQIHAGDNPLIGAAELAGRYNFDTAPAMGLRLTWPIGVLLQADNAEGPYTPVPNAVSPYVVNPTEARKFYLISL